MTILFLVVLFMIVGSTASASSPFAANATWSIGWPLGPSIEESFFPLSEYDLTQPPKQATIDIGQRDVGAVMAEIALDCGGESYDTVRCRRGDDGLVSCGPIPATVADWSNIYEVRYGLQLDHLDRYIWPGVASGDWLPLGVRSHLWTHRRRWGSPVRWARAPWRAPAT